MACEQDQLDLQAYVRDGSTIVQNIRFDGPIDEALLDATVPAGYELVHVAGLTPEQLRPEATAEEAAVLVIRPGTGVGPFTFGMTREQVEAQLVPPEASHRSSIEYYSRGLRFEFDEKKGIRLITCRHEGYSGFNARSFPGKTDKGIGINATRDQVDAVHGKPAGVRIDQPFTGAVLLKYPDGMRIVLLDGRVVAIELGIRGRPLD